MRVGSLTPDNLAYCAKLDSRCASQTTGYNMITINLIVIKK